MRDANADVSDPGPVRYSPTWLDLREGADARARARGPAAALVGLLAGELDRTGRAVVHDLGCGTGSMGRWLAPLLPGPQHWVLHDCDPQLLQLAAAQMPHTAADGTPVTVQVSPGDLTRLTAADLSGACLVTASALLDLLTRAEVDRLAAACTQVGCAVLFTLSVTGRVELSPADPLDAAIGEAFNAHQRRVVAGRRLLGPDAVAAVAGTLTRLGARVEVCASPWQLAAEESALAMEWLRGWVGAAGEQDPGLAAQAYLTRRETDVEAGLLRVTVHHSDVFAR